MYQSERGLILRKLRSFLVQQFVDLPVNNVIMLHCIVILKQILNSSKRTADTLCSHSSLLLQVLDFNIVVIEFIVVHFLYITRKFGIDFFKKASEISISYTHLFLDKNHKNHLDIQIYNIEIPKRSWIDTCLKQF